MIRAYLYKDREGYIRGYKISGHANYDESGKDIVCSAVSVVSQVSLMSLIEIANLNENELEYTIDNINGSIEVSIKESYENVKVDTLMKSLELALKSIEEGYGEYITLKYREV